MYADVGALERDVARVLRPPPNQSVAESAVRHVILRTPGGYNGPWSNDLPHYLVEPAECLTDRRFPSVIFAGPSQCAKTSALVDNYIAHTVVVDPVDTMVVQTNQDEARDYSRRRVDRMHRDSPDVGRELAPFASANNTHDKQYRSGMILSIQWPTTSTFRGKAIGRVIITDVDGIADDIGGEGTAFELAENRAKTFGSRGKVVAESSPAREPVTPRWDLSHPHEAPPCTGILGLFNSGDRRRAYCQCQHCGEYWLQPMAMQNVWMPEGGDLEERIERMGLTCPVCAALNSMQEHERAIKRSVRWVKQGQSIDNTGAITGEARFSRRASFWLPGWFAAFETWAALVRKHENAMAEYESTGRDGALKTIYNTGFGDCFVPMARRQERSTEAYSARAEPELERGIVPSDARVLIGSVDVQKTSFVVQFEAFGERGESWIVDRFDIAFSGQSDEEGRPIAVAPGSRSEDWQVLEGQVIDREFPIEGEDDRRVTAALVVCDLHGVPGASRNAYAFWRRCRANGRGKRFQLLRGGASRKAAEVVRTVPDRRVSGKIVPGDVPVLTLNTHALKDSLFVGLERTNPGPGYTHFPSWLPASWYDELLAEIRIGEGTTGKWEKVANRNEAIDLLVYARAAFQHLGGDRIDWTRPPRWAAPWPENVHTVGGSRAASAAPRLPAFLTDDGPMGGGDRWLD